jgi:thiol-disulfide isomerase/thioredoxin
MRSLAFLCILFPVIISVLKAEDAAGSRWRELQGLHDKTSEPVPIGTNAVEFYAGRQKTLHDAAGQFVTQFPKDSHAPEAMIWKIDATDFPAPAEQRLSLLQENERDVMPLVTDPALPASLRFQIQRKILSQWFENSDLITTPEQANRLEERIAELVQNNPKEPRDASLQLAKATLMLRFDHEKGVAFLQELTKAPDQTLAEEAKARLLKTQMIGKPLELQFTALDGSPFDLQALSGKIVLVDFWATWCPDCLRELPAVRATYQKYKDKGFVIVGISLDKDVQALSNFVARKLIPWPQYFDGKGWENELVTKYDVRAIPEMWLIDQRGDVVSTNVSAQELDRRIEQLMNSGGQLSRN